MYIHDNLELASSIAHSLMEDISDLQATVEALGADGSYEPYENALDYVLSQLDDWQGSAGKTEELIDEALEEKKEVTQ